MTIPTLQFRPDAGDGVHVDLERLIASRVLIQANSGGGKSWLTRYLLEQTFGQVQHVVLDPEGEFASLRERFPYVLAGKEGDVPAEPKVAKLLCRRLVETGASAVVDLYDLKLQERRRFVRLFLEELMHLPRSLWRPLVVVLDEAHRFIPEKGSSEASDAVIALCSQGRKRGFAAVLVTQRLSKLNKDAAAELLNVMIGRTQLDVDAKRAADVLGFDKDRRLTLRDLKPGEFYAFGPALPTNEVTLVRSGGVETTHPEPGRIAAEPPPAPEELGDVLAELRDLPEQAEEEERTIEDLRRKVGQLERELRSARNTDAAPAVDESEIRERLEEEFTEQLRQHLGEAIARGIQLAAERFTPPLEVLGQTQRELDLAAARLKAEIEEAHGALEELTGDPPLPEDLRIGGFAPLPRSGGNPRTETHGSLPAPRAKRSAKVTSAPAGAISRDDLNPSERSILDAIAYYHELVGEPWPARNKVGAFAGVPPSKSTLRNALSTLRKNGLIRDRDATYVALTEAGLSLAHVPEIPPSPDERLVQFSRDLNPSEEGLLRYAFDAYPETVERVEAAFAAGIDPEKSTLRNALSTLRSRGLIEDESTSRFRVSDVLYPGGRP